LYGDEEDAMRAGTRKLSAVVYDQRTGRVLHVHEVVIGVREKGPTESELEARAIELARMMKEGKTRTRAASPDRTVVLHVLPSDIEGKHLSKVDVKSKKLVYARPPGQTGSRAPKRRA
jgi:hypothetical protein